MSARHYPFIRSGPVSSKRVKLKCDEFVSDWTIHLFSILLHILAKFYRVQNEKTREVKGTGLSLAIVKSIVEVHNGRIQVESNAGEGSPFTVRLPRQS